MKIRLPLKIGDRCALCLRRCGKAHLARCLVCGRDYCSVCGTAPNDGLPPPEVCDPCADLPPVKALLKRFAEQLVRVLRQRQQALRRKLGKSATQNRP